MPIRISPPQWIDMFGPASQGLAAAALTEKAYRDTGFVMQWMVSNQADALCMAVQLNHNVEQGQQVRCHLHMIPTGNGAGNLYFSVRYTWTTRGTAIPALSGWTVPTNITHAVALADRYKPQIVSLFTANAPVAQEASDFVLVYLSRLGNDPLDTYDSGDTDGTAAANMAILGIDCHVQVDKFGSDAEGSYGT